ncbi:MAG TPA: ABC transporter permease [Candidatus Omnitrophota bacterium]|nr:ABC transporter permease [Candidatus Omnitrophota bacterium]HPS36475.1 ABC transporter permease [Candidatus Omnitrophota bacterium]
MKEFAGKTGQTLFFVLAGVARLWELGAAVVGYTLSSFFKRKVIPRETFFRQMVLMGIDSTAIVSLVGGSVGTVLALQAAYSLKTFGAIMYTGSLVSVAMARELGPLIASIVICGRIGARMAAEIGTMMVQEEVDALTTMGINPIRYLVLPRCLALAIMLPCLTVIADLMGMLGGFAIGTTGLGINPYIYIAKSLDALVLKDVYTGLLKSFIFSILIALVSCHQGLSVSGGADAVGKATTQAVVISIVLIIVVDCVATAVIYYALPT